jgi:glutathione S-transferase
MSNDYAAIHLVSLLAVFEYLLFMLAVGRGRYTYGVKAPAVTGSEDFERLYRVQMNTLEMLVIFVPALWAFAIFVSTAWAGLLGALFILGRALYFVGYSKSADKRSIGFTLSFLPTLALLLGGLFGAGRAFFA